MDIPSPLTYGTVTGRFISVLADSTDAGSDPDAITLNGSVAITPVVPNFHIIGPPSQLVVATTVTASIVNGDLVSADGLALRLLASDSPGINPSPIQYTASFTLVGVKAQPKDVTFSVPSGDTVDIGAIIGLPAVAPVLTVVSETSRIAAEAAAADAAVSAATINTKVSAVSLSQSAYDALSTPDPTTLYLITS